VSKAIKVVIVGACMTLAGLSGAFAQGTSTLTICKKTIPSGGAGFPFVWENGNGGPQAPFTLNDAGCQTFDVTHKDKFNRFTENVPPGWALTKITCTAGAVNITGPKSTTPAFEPGDDTVAIDLNRPNVTCTFVNERTPLSTQCPIRTIPTVIDGVSYCCTTDNDGGIGSGTGSFCCTRACPPGTFETTVNGAAFCCDIGDPAGNDSAQLCCKRKSGRQISTPDGH